MDGLIALVASGILALLTCLKVVDLMTDPGRELPRMPEPLVVGAMVLLLVSIPFLWVAIQLRGGRKALEARLAATPTR